MVTEKMLNEAYEGLKVATENYSGAVEDALETKHIYEIKVSNALATGEIEGKNASIREANARELFKREHGLMVLHAKEERVAKLEFDLARLEVEHVRALLRLMEVTRVP